LSTAAFFNESVITPPPTKTKKPVKRTQPVKVEET
jgi:hypothetical protein